MKLKVLQKFFEHEPGDVIELPDRIRAVWIERGYVEPYEKSLDKPPINKAIQNPKHKKAIRREVNVG